MGSPKKTIGAIVKGKGVREYKKTGPEFHLVERIVPPDVLARVDKEVKETFDEGGTVTIRDIQV